MGADNAESRAVMILSGLQFSAERQVARVCDLSGGWKMRVALAGTCENAVDVDFCVMNIAPLTVRFLLSAALFVEPEILVSREYEDLLLGHRQNTYLTLLLTRRCSSKCSLG